MSANSSQEEQVSDQVCGLDLPSFRCESARGLRAKGKEQPPCMYHDQDSQERSGSYCRKTSLGWITSLGWPRLGLTLWSSRRERNPDFCR